MERIPDELLLQIVSLLTPDDILSTQLISLRFRKIGRDNNLWKRICFDNSRSEAIRRRQDLFARQDEVLVNLRQAIGASTTPWLQNLVNDPNVARGQQRSQDGEQRKRALANWDPTYSSESINFYQEYIHRHAPISLTWLPKEKPPEGSPEVECVGMGLIDDAANGDAQKLLSTFEDGSIRIYDLGSLRASERKVMSVVAQTSPAYLFGDGAVDGPRRRPGNEIEATENVTIDSGQRKAYVATFDCVNELDLNTLQVIRRQLFPFPITALSAAQHAMPLTVGTNFTLHLFDTRSGARHSNSNMDNTVRCEMIGGAAPINPVSDLHNGISYSTTAITLSQPGPLSILHNPSGDPSDHAIYVAGRFTSLLHYDRRVWPRIAGTIFSGARLSSLSSIPQPYIPRRLDLTRNESASNSQLQTAKAMPGATLIAAGEYKGKGSLELYGISSPASTSSSPRSEDNTYRNRQTASKSRLLSVAPHGTRVVFSDGDGNVKWAERDGVSVVRTFNINTDVPVNASGNAGSGSGGQERLASQASQARNGSENINASTSGGIFGTADDEVDSDIVRKIIPRLTGRSALSDGIDDTLLYRDDLLIQTGEGKLGMIAFGSREPQSEHGALHEEALSAEEAAKEKQERAYGLRMREALERHADEARWVRGLGMGFRMFG